MSCFEKSSSKLSSSHESSHCFFTPSSVSASSQSVHKCQRSVTPLRSRSGREGVVPSCGKSSNSSSSAGEGSGFWLACAAAAVVAAPLPLVADIRCSIARRWYSLHLTSRKLWPVSVPSCKWTSNREVLLMPILNAALCVITDVPMTYSTHRHCYPTGYASLIVQATTRAAAPQIDHRVWLSPPSNCGLRAGGR